MLPFQGYYGLELESCLDPNSGLVEEPSSAMKMKSSTDGGDDSTTNSASRVETKSGLAWKSHKEAERRRRQRINAHLSTLRTLLPNTTKTDKASLLAEVVNHVKELSKQAADVARQDGDVCSSGLEAEPWPFPGESDEATLCYCDSEEKKLMKATLCCEDRPGLNMDLARAIRSVRARVVRAEMMTIGGRTKSVLVLQWAGNRGLDEIEVLKRALKAVMENRASGTGLGQMGSGNKRPRVFGSLNQGRNELLLKGSFKSVVIDGNGLLG